VTTESLSVDIRRPPRAASRTPGGPALSTDKTVADRLLDEARAKTARSESPTIGKIALIIGVVALLVSPISILGWVFGAAAIGVGVAAVRRPQAATQARIAMTLGAAAILVGVFFFTLNIAQG
jgi:hypothetical protein